MAQVIEHLGVVGAFSFGLVQKVCGARIVRAPIAQDAESFCDFRAIRVRLASLYRPIISLREIRRVGVIEQRKLSY